MKSKRALELEEPEEGEETAPKSSKSSGILGALAKSLKRKTSDRSPEATISSKKGGPRGTLVGVIVPSPPIPHSSYTQLPVRTSAPSSVISVSDEPAPPLSSSPSLVSFTSTAPDRENRDFELNRLNVLLNASQENLALQRRQFEEREKLQQAQFDAERVIYATRIRELQEPDRGEGGSGVRRS